jgi:hypothetical protein
MWDLKLSKKWLPKNIPPKMGKMDLKEVKFTEGNFILLRRIRTRYL